jgi:hypothetical protein
VLLTRVRIPSVYLNYTAGSLPVKAYRADINAQPKIAADRIRPFIK